MSRPVKVSLLVRGYIVGEGLREILSSTDIHVDVLTSDVTTLLEQLNGKEGDHSRHVILIEGGEHGFGLDVCDKLAAEQAGVRLVLLLNYYSMADVVDAFRVGVDGVVISEISSAPLTESVRLVASGEKVLPSQLVADLNDWIPNSPVNDWRDNAAAIGLSGREVEVLENIVIGMPNKAIARRFGICEATVKVHVKAVLRKLGVENRTQAATWAVRRGLPEPTQLKLTELLPTFVRAHRQFGPSPPDSSAQRAG